MSALIDPRTRLIRLIHVAQREMQLDDETYRALLKNATGLSSCGDMNEVQLEQVVAKMKGGGFQPRSRASAEAKHGQAALIVALWIDLWMLAAVSDRQDSALDAFVKGQTGVEKMLWLSPSQANSVVEALKAWCKREGLHLDAQPGDVDPGLAAKRAVCIAIYRKLKILDGGAEGFSLEMDRCSVLDVEEAHGLARRMAYRLHALKKLARP